jgi:hypothetical protein
MAAISLDNLLLQYWPLLEQEEKKSIITHIKSLIISKQSSTRLTLNEFIVQYNKDMDEAEADIKAGRVISQEYLELESENWQYAL